MRNWTDMHSWLDVWRMIAAIAGMLVVVTMIAATFFSTGLGAIWSGTDPWAEFSSNWAAISRVTEEWSASVVSWLVPLLATVLVTILVWLAIPTQVDLRPRWSGASDEAQIEDATSAKGLIEVRLVMGKTAVAIAAAHIAWSAWALTWLIGSLFVSEASAQGTPLAAIIVTLPIILVLGLAAGRFARSRAEPLLDLMKARDQIQRVDERIHKLKRRVAFRRIDVPGQEGDRPERVADRGLWLNGSVVGLGLSLVVACIAVLAASGWSLGPGDWGLAWQLPIWVLLIFALGSLFCAPAMYMWLRSISFEDRIISVVLFIGHALLTLLLLLFSALYSGQEFGPVTGIALAIQVLLPTLIWTTPWWSTKLHRDRNLNAAFLLGGTAYRSLIGTRAFADSRRRNLEGVLWDEYHTQPTRRWRLALRPARTNPWTTPAD